jgi:adenine-specific DNA glycosylase
MAGDCRARAAGNPERYPPPRPRRATVELRWVAACCYDLEGSFLVRQVDKGPILRGLWLPPLAELSDGASAVAVAGELVPLALRSAPRALAAVQHSITHRRIEVLPVLLEAADSGRASATDRWVDPARPGVPTSSLFSKLLRKMDLNTELSTE